MVVALLEGYGLTVAEVMGGEVVELNWRVGGWYFGGVVWVNIASGYLRDVTSETTLSMVVV